MPQRIGESVIIALISSVGLYLVGTVYLEAYYSRLAIEVSSLDFAPPYVALQSVHALAGLLQYPVFLLLVSVVYRTVSRAGRSRTWFEHNRQRFLQLLPVLANLLFVAPMLVDAFADSFLERDLPHRSVLTEIRSVLGYGALILLGYVVWLGWSQRRFLVSEVPARKLLPIALAFLVYLLGALATTGVVAELAAMDLLTGASEANLASSSSPSRACCPS